MSEGSQAARKMGELVDVYQMPKHMGGDWAFAAAGIISDGYESEIAAYRAAAEMLAELVVEMMQKVEGQ